MEIIWRPIPGWEGLYEASNTGLIRSVDRYRSHYITKKALIRGKLIASKIDRYGYYALQLHGNGKIYSRTVHRLIAQTFVLNPENKTQINHKDGDKLNNHEGNLEWCTVLENQIHLRIKLGDKRNFGVPVIQKGMGDEIIKIWPTASSTRRGGFNPVKVSAVANGKRKSHGGYKWNYEI